MIRNHFEKRVNRIAAVVLALTVGVCGCSEVSTYPESVAEERILKPLMIVAHRGGMAYAPENTVVGARNGYRLMSEMLEFDIQVVNGELMALHDFTLSRTTNCDHDSTLASGPVRASCDAGYWWQAGSSTFSGGIGPHYFRGSGLGVPLLAEIVDSLDDPDIRFMLELKHLETGPGQQSTEAALTALLDFIVEYSLEDRVWVNSSNAHVLSRTEAILPNVITVISWGDQSANSCEATVMDAVSRGIDAVSLQASQRTQDRFGECVRMAQDFGKLVAFWVVNRPSEVEALLQFRPDAILTDFPACLVALLRDIRIENPYPDRVGNPEYLPKCG